MFHFTACNFLRRSLIINQQLCSTVFAPALVVSARAQAALSALKFEVDLNSVEATSEISKKRYRQLMEILETTNRQNVSEKLDAETVRNIFQNARKDGTLGPVPPSPQVINAILERGRETELPQLRKAAIAVCKKALSGKKLPDSVCSAAFTVLCADAEWLFFVSEEICGAPTGPKKEFSETKNEELFQNFKECFIHMTRSFVIQSLTLDSKRESVPRVSQILAALWCMSEQIDATARSHHLSKAVLHFCRFRCEITMEFCLEQLWNADFESIFQQNRTKLLREASAATSSSNSPDAHIRDEMTAQKILLSSNAIAFSASNNSSVVANKNSPSPSSPTSSHQKCPLPAGTHIFLYISALLMERSIQRLLEVHRSVSKMKSLSRMVTPFIANRLHVTTAVWAERLLREYSVQQKLTQQKSSAENDSAESSSVVIFENLNSISSEAGKLLFLLQEAREFNSVAPLMAESVASLKRSTTIISKLQNLLTVKEKDELGRNSSRMSGDLLDVNTSAAETKTGEKKNETTNSIAKSSENSEISVIQKTVQLPKNFPEAWGVLIKTIIAKRLKKTLKHSEESINRLSRTAIPVISPSSALPSFKNALVEKVAPIIEPYFDMTTKLEYDSFTYPALQNAIKSVMIQLYKKFPSAHIALAQLGKEADRTWMMKRRLAELKSKNNNTNASSENNGDQEEEEDELSSKSMKPLFESRAEHFITEHARETLLLRLKKCTSVRVFASLLDELALTGSDSAVNTAIRSTSENIGKAIQHELTRRKATQNPEQQQTALQQQQQQQQQVTTTPLENETPEGEKSLSSEQEEATTKLNNENPNILTAESTQDQILAHLRCWLRNLEFETRYSGWREKVAVEEILYQRNLKNPKSGLNFYDDPESPLAKQHHHQNKPDDEDNESNNNNNTSLVHQHHQVNSRNLSFNFFRAARVASLVAPNAFISNENVVSTTDNKELQKQQHLARLWLRTASFGLIDYTTTEIPDPRLFLIPSPSKARQNQQATFTTSQNDLLVEAAAAPTLQLMSEMAKYKKLSVQSQSLLDVKHAVLGRILAVCNEMKLPKYLSAQSAFEEFAQRHNIKDRDAVINSSGETETEPQQKEKEDDANSRKSLPAASSPSQQRFHRNRHRHLQNEAAAFLFIPEFHHNNSLFLEHGQTVTCAPTASMWRILANAVSLIPTSEATNLVEELRLFENETEVNRSVVHAFLCCLAQTLLSDSRAPCEMQLSRMILYLALMTKKNEKLARCFVEHERFTEIFSLCMMKCIRFRPPISPQQNSTAAGSGGGRAAQLQAIQEQQQADRSHDFHLKGLIALSSCSKIILEALSDPSSKITKREILDPFREMLSRGTCPPASWKTEDVVTICVAVCSVPELLAFATSSFFDRISQRLDEFKESELKSMLSALAPSSSTTNSQKTKVLLVGLNSSLSAGLVDGIKQRLSLSAKSAGEKNLENEVKTSTSKNVTSAVVPLSLSSAANLPKHAADAAKIELIRKFEQPEFQATMDASDLLQCLRASQGIKKGNEAPASIQKKTGVSGNNNNNNNNVGSDIPGVILRNGVRSFILKDLSNRKSGELPKFANLKIVREVLESAAATTRDEQQAEIDQELHQAIAMARNQTLVELARVMSTCFFGDEELWKEWNIWIEEWIGHQQQQDQQQQSEQQQQATVNFLSRIDIQSLKAVRYVAGV